MSIEDKDEKKKHFDWQFDNYLDHIYKNKIDFPEDVKFVNPVDTSFALNTSPEIGVYNGYETHNPLKILTDELDGILSNIHEPISENDKKFQKLEQAIFELQLNDEQKDIKIQELREKLEKKKKQNKTKKQRTKTSPIVELKKEIVELKKKVSMYEPDWRFTKDAHKEEAKDISEE